MAQRRVSDAFRRPEHRPRTQEPDTSSPEPVATPEPVAKPAATRNESKYSVLLGVEDAATFDQLAVDLRRTVGRRVAKSEVLRALVILASDDATIRDALTNELRKGG